ncbi:Zinc finger MYM-type protein 1 [Holothuria leucospilota]|uniref:Zinc finger MYM-type protein 1 n=1 Tax=Holothuria leucospilota TaxID=206669 RepID=A0A9Q1BBA0_HOLLE|nr:Zinc finger MYM-type protein 1 [Holothuria leucospilota]
MEADDVLIECNTETVMTAECDTNDNKGEESEKGNTEGANDDLDWLDCAGQLSHLAADFKVVQTLLDGVRGESCPLVETFLTNVKEITSQITEKSQSLHDNAEIVLNNFKEKKKMVDDACPEVVHKVPPHDPGERGEIKHDSERKYLVNIGPHQPKLRKFPQNKDIPAKKQCRFSSTWYMSYPHLEYSIKEDAAYCYVCSLFSSDTSDASDKAWSTCGVRQWHKMMSRGAGKKGKLAEHFESTNHKNALRDFIHFCNESAHIDILLDKDRRANLIQSKHDQMMNREAVTIIMDIERTLARQGLPFRGTTDADNKETDGNFYQLVQLVARHNAVMKRWLDEKRMRPYQVTYLSPHSQNEIITLLGKHVRKQISTEAQMSQMYAVMADTTPDASNKDRLAVALRYVNESGVVKERLLEVKETLDKTGAVHAADIIKSLEDNDLDTTQLAFQSYDFASNMSGKHKGAQAEIEKELERSVPYIPCQAHRTNTVVEHACDSSTMVQELFNILQELYVFFSGSTKRHNLLTTRMKEIEDALNLRNLSKTRWTARAEAIQSVWRSYDAIIAALEDIMSSPPPSDKKTLAVASGLYRRMHNLDFVVAIMVMKNIMMKTMKLTEELQNDELNIVDALGITKATIQSLERVAAEEVDAQIEAACSFAEKLGIDPKHDFERLHRVRRPSRRIDDHPDTASGLTLHQFYRKECRCVLDTLITQLKDKMQPTLDIIKPLEQVLGIPFKLPKPEEVACLAALFPCEVNADVLTVELELFKGLLENAAVTNSVSEAARLAHQHRRTLPLTWKAYQLLLTAPITVAKDERTFSHLKFVKSFLRT